MLDRVALWVFPEQDFAEWCDLVGTPEAGSYAEYMTLLAAVQADCERQGQAVERVYFAVAEMRDELDARGLENTPDNRAAVTALRFGYEQK